MTWKEQRIVTFLTSILLILAAALLVVLGIRYQENRDKKASANSISTENGISEPEQVYTELSYDNGSATLSFARDETNQWYWAGDYEFPLDKTVISSIMQFLTDWQPQQTLTASDIPESNGLSEPAATLSATDSSGTTTTLLFGKTTEDGKSYYTCFRGEENTVFIVDGALYELISVPIYDMCQLPKLPKLTEDCLQSIIIYGMADGSNEVAESMVLAAQRADADTATTWRASGANVTDLSIVRNLLQDIADLTIVKCIDYNPSNEAASLCGFDSPAVRLFLSCTTESGTDQEVSFTIAGTLLDGSGRYVRMNDDTTIYSIANEHLDALLQIAAEGLEG